MDKGKTAYFSEAFLGSEALGFTGICGVAQKGNKSCGCHSSTLSGFSRMHSNSRIHSYSRIHGYDRMQQDTRLDYRIHSRSTGYLAELQDTQPPQDTAGYTTGLLDTQPPQDTAG